MRSWSTAAGIRAQLETELQNRRRVLLAMHEQGIRDFREVSRVIQAYAIDPERVLASLPDPGRLFR
jgi:flagellar protein FlaI